MEENTILDITYSDFLLDPELGLVRLKNEACNSEIFFYFNFLVLQLKTKNFFCLIFIQ